ncbi:MAG: ABC transporter ATP-binding protein, partial [Boseongicola sp. SB0662_bin_57]|nr:ABC transporter ATP-binding protein [Boseongicola sp. SB0662_bin_57]
MAEIVLSNISKRWGSFAGVHDLDLTMADREFLVPLGPSGCGKTATMRMVAELDDPSSGEISIDDRVVNDLEPKDRDAAMVFRSCALYPNMNVYENIRFPLKVRGVNPATHDEWVRRASAMAELDDFLHRKPAELSGGQRQRVVQQVGTPTGTYDKPANAFVASLIGNPAMNLVDGEMAGGSFKAETALIEGLSAPDGPLTLGFRAEDAEVVFEGGQINAPIYTMELLGDATMVSVRIGGSLISVKAGKNYRAEIDDTVSIRISTDHCHLFDAKTGER